MSDIQLQASIIQQSSEMTIKHEINHGSHGMPQAMYELARTYLMMRNYREAIQWALALGENSRLISQAENVLSQVVEAAVDPSVQAQAKQALDELQARKNFLANEAKRNALEKASFLVQVEEA